MDGAFVGETYTITCAVDEAGGGRVTATHADSPVVEYALIFGGETVGSGEAAYANGVWAADVALPATPGVLHVHWTATVGDKVGKKHQSIRVRAL
jgi:hypothetical protein